MQEKINQQQQQQKSMEFHSRRRINYFIIYGALQIQNQFENRCLQKFHTHSHKPIRH